MGHSTTIFGCIECLAIQAETNQKVLDHFEFDEVYPLPNCFGEFTGARGYATAGFAQILAGDDNESWDDWLARFRVLLADMHFLFASVVLDGETRSHNCHLLFLREETEIKILRTLVKLPEPTSINNLATTPY